MSTSDRRSLIEEITLSRLVIGYDKPLSAEINMTIKPGTSAWLTGPSGGGKSTLLKILAGLMNPIKGDVYLNGDPVIDFSFEEFLKYRLSIGYSFDMGGLLNNRTLWDNIMLPLAYHKWVDPAEAEKRVRVLVKNFALERYVNERPAAVPGGVRKAACVARSFILEPNVYLLDDPATGLNEEGLDGLNRIMKQIYQSGDAIILLTSRNADFAKSWLNTEYRMSSETFEEWPLAEKGVA